VLKAALAAQVLQNAELGWVTSRSASNYRKTKSKNQITTTSSMVPQTHCGTCF
jgi:hypothetical protein